MEKFLFISVFALCGTLASSSTAEGASRIVNGTEAFSQERYVISLQKISELHLYTRGHRCGGVLVSLQHALTAASCNFDEANGVFTAINTAEYRVFSGARFLTADSTHNTTRGIRKIVVHPQYFTNTPYVNDIAVIFLVQPFTYDTSTPVSLPIRDPDFVALTTCKVAGWGAQNGTATASVQLMQLNKWVTSRGDCRTYYVGQNINVLDTMICANAVERADFAGCTGDIGNPLVCRDDLNGILIVSKNCTVSRHPEVYTRITSYNPWIRSLTGIPPFPTLSGASTFQPGMAVLAVIAIAQILVANVST